MKKILLTALVMLGLAAGATAQDNAIGLRLGWGWEISYQKMLKQNNRLELDLGLPGAGVGANLAGIYQWVKPLPQLAKGFNWYYGVGANVGFWGKSTGSGDYKTTNSTINAGVVGQLGLEYKFSIPLALSVDWRPSLGIYSTTTKNDYNNHTSTGFYDGGLWGFALGIRYIF